MSHPLLNALEPLIQGLARDFTRPGVEPADLAQEMRVWVLQNHGKVNDWLEDGEEHMVRGALKNRCRRQLAEAEDQHQGRGHDNPEPWRREKMRALVKAKFLVPEGEDSEVLGDLMDAWNTLGESDRAVLTARHRDGLSNNKLARLEGTSRSTIATRESRAIERLLRALDQIERDNFGEWSGRRAISNASARYYQNNEIGGDWTSRVNPPREAGQHRLDIEPTNYWPGCDEHLDDMDDVWR